MGVNADYYHALRARGVCSLCRFPIADDNGQLAHSACYRLKRNGFKEREIREMMTRKERERVAALPQKYARSAA